MNEDSTILETLSGNYGTFGISTMGNSLFIKFETGNTWEGSSSWFGFFATIYYGTYNNIYFCLVYDLNFLKQIPTCFMLVTKHKYI